MTKYGNRKCTYNGHTFDSTKERNRYCDLLLMQKGGTIKDLELQKEFVLIPAQKLNGKVVERACKYRADFYYYDNEKGRYICEDTKGFKTKEYVIKRKLMLYVHNIKVVEL